MLEFTPTVQDAVELAIWRAERDGSALRTRVYFWISGLCLSILLGAAAAGGAAAGLGLLWRPAAVIGLVLGLIGWLLVMSLFPDARRAWSDYRASRATRRAFRSRGTVQVWMDANGVSIREAGLHTHLTWTAIDRVVDTPDHVVVLARTGLHLDIPKRAGAAEIDLLIATIADRIEAGQSPSPNPAPLAALPPRPNPGHRADLEIILTAADLEALADNAERRSPPSAAEHDFRLGTATRTFVVVSVIAMPIVRGMLRQTGFAVVAPTLLFAAATALLGWFLAGRVFATRIRGEHARGALQEFANTSDHRWLWLESDGLGWSDAVIARKAEWACLSLDYGPDHYFVHTADRTAGIAIPRRIGSAADSFASSLGDHMRSATDQAGDSLRAPSAP